MASYQKAIEFKCSEKIKCGIMADVQKSLWRGAKPWPQSISMTVKHGLDLAKSCKGWKSTTRPMGQRKSQKAAVRKEGIWTKYGRTN